MSEAANTGYIDPRYEIYKAPFSERRKEFQRLWKKEREDIRSLKDQKRQACKEIRERTAQEISKGVDKKTASRLSKGELDTCKLRFNAKIAETKKELRDNRFMIEPFRFFYTPVHAGNNVLLKPQGKGLVASLIIFVITVISFFFMQFERVRISGDSFFSMISQMFGPQTTGLTNLTTWDLWLGYMWKTAVPLIWETFAMMFIATTIGALASLPFMVLCSRNIVTHKSVNFVFRFFLNIIRTIPTPVLGIIGVACFGLGNVAGMFAMVLFTAGIIIKVMYEYIETVDMHPYEAILSTGATKPKAFITSIFPQILPVFLSNIIYTFEINIRASIILGYVNAGGIGKEINDAMNNYQFNKVGAVLIPLLILVLVLQLFSNWLKRRTL